jgi:predicted nucleic acid-binding Zn ribbon protein
MTPSSDRACPSCSAPARDDQQWCLECGTELPDPSRRAGRRSGIGLATTLAVLVAATSAGAYSLIQDGAKPPPPTTTVAQELPPPVTEPTPVVPLPPAPEPTPLPPGGDDELPGLDDGGGDVGDGADLGDPGLDDGSGDLGGGADTDGGADVGGSTPSGGGDSGTDGRTGDGDDAGRHGRLEDDDAAPDRGTTRRPTRPRLVETDIALGAVAVTYPPLSGEANPGDPAALVDGSRRTAWETPSYEDPATSPQIGAYVDLASVERLTRLIIASPTPGATVEVYGARSGPPRAVTGRGWRHLATTTLRARTTVKLPAGARYRFVLLWVTALPPDGDHVAISELQVRSKQPA